MPTPDPTRILRLVLATAVAALAGCGSSPYADYRAAHPDWRPMLPHANGLHELVAALHGPDGIAQARVKLENLKVYDLGRQPWPAVDPASIGEAEAAAGDFAVIARRDCLASKGGERIEVIRVDSYLLRRGRLVAYDHTDYRADCAAHARFLAARGDAVSLEHAIAARIRDEYGRRPLVVTDLYRRGVAYVEAGRLAEAEAALRLGEKGYLVFDKAMSRKDAEVDEAMRESLAEARRLRARLHRALGLELPES